MFTRSTRKFNRFVCMDGQLIPYSKSVVFPGVTMDSELKWKEHIDNKIKKKRLLMKMSSITSAYWGPRPKLMKWAFTGIVRPTFTYGAMVWAHVKEGEDVITSFCRLNHIAINTIVKVPRSTPTQALEIILDIMPLHLHVFKEGLATFLCIMPVRSLLWTGVYPNLAFSVSHLRFWEYNAQAWVCSVIRKNRRMLPGGTWA